MNPVQPNRPHTARPSHPLNPRRLAWTLTIAALLGCVSAPFLYPMLQLWQAKREIQSGDNVQMAKGLGTLKEVALQSKYLAGYTANVFVDLMQDENLFTVLRSLAQQVGPKNKKLVKAWTTGLDDTADNDPRFQALYRLILAAGQWDEKIPLQYRLRAANLRMVTSTREQRVDTLSAFTDFNPAEVRQNVYWPTLRANLLPMLEPAELPSTRASALTVLTRIGGQVPPELREKPLPQEAVIAWEIGLLLLTGPIEDAPAWQKWLTGNLADWKPILPPTSQPNLSASATMPESQPVSQPAHPLEELAWTVLRMAQGRLSAGADLPAPDKVLSMPELQRRAIAAALRYAEPNLLARYAEVLLNEEEDPVVRARVCLAFQYRPSPAARAPLMYIATHAVLETNWSDDEWVAGHLERMAALSALADNREADDDDPALFEFLWKLTSRDVFSHEEIEEAICCLRTLGTHPASVTSRSDLANLRILSFLSSAWQMKRAAARTWLIRSRLGSTQPDAAGPTSTASSPAEIPASGSQPTRQAGLERLKAAATPSDAYLAMLGEMDYYEPEQGPPADADAQGARLMAMFDAWQLTIFPPAQLETLFRSISSSERESAILLAGLTHDETLRAALLQRQKLEPEALARQYLKISLGILAHPPETLPIEEAYFLRDIPRPLLYWADFAAGNRLPLDRLFQQQEFPRTLMQINRFEDVVRTYFPSMPPVPLAADYDLRMVGFALQRCWWMVRSPDLQYDPSLRQWLEPTNRDPGLSPTPKMSNPVWQPISTSRPGVSSAHTN